MFAYENDIRVRGINLWLDGRRKHEFGFISHAHSDHVCRHSSILASTPTKRFLEKRFGYTNIESVSYRSRLDIGQFRVSLYPAGHILGSAQILVESNYSKLLYSGDFRIRTSYTAEDIVVPTADYLIVDATYGSPRFKFPPRNTVIEQFLVSVSKALKQEKVPIVYCYALGKAQEVTKILTDNGFDVVQYKKIYQLSEVYKEFGVNLGNVQPIEGSNITNKVLILAPKHAKSDFVRKIPRKRTYFLTGWALENERKRRHVRVNEMYPFSDHADYHELLQYIEMVRPQKVYTLYGYYDIFEDLRMRGFDVEPIIPPKH